MINGPWLKNSIMAKRGLAKGQAGPRHELSITAQGDFHYVYGPYAKPVLTVNPGDVVVVETEDAFGGVITSEQDSPTAKLQFPFLNPQCGPVAISGLEKGDCLAVHIHAVETRGAQPAGTTCIIPEFGGLVGTASTAMLNAPLPERVRKMHVDKDGVRWSDKIILPHQPFIGTIDEHGLRLRRDRRVYASQSGRTHPARKHGRPKIHDGRVDPEKISGLMTYRQHGGGVRQ